MAGSTRSTKFIYFMMFLFVVGGCANTIFLKMQNEINALGVDFQHPWFQAQTLFIGEIYCLIIYFIMRRVKPRFNTSKEYDKEGNLKGRPTKFQFIIPTILDFLAQTCQMFALGNLPASVFAMFRGGSILTTALLSKILFKRVFHRHHFIGMFLIVVGIFLVGYASYNPDKVTDGNVALGYVFTVIFLLLFCFQMISEEAIVLKYKSHAIELAGWQGFWGFLFCGIILVVFQFIPCNDGFPLREDICSKDDYGNYTMENTIFALQQTFSDIGLFFYVFGYTVSTCIQNMFGISVTKFGTAATRAVTDNLRPVIVWIFFLVVKDGKGNREEFLWLQLVGFILMILGILIYNEIIELCFCRLNIKTKNYLEKEDMTKDEILFKSYQINLIESEIKEIDNLNRGLLSEVESDNNMTNSANNDANESIKDSIHSVNVVNNVDFEKLNISGDNNRSLTK